MGTYYQAVLIVGLPRETLEAAEVGEDVMDELDTAAPYYDGGDDAVLGVIVEQTGDYQAKEIALDQARIDSAKAEFRELTGQDGKLYLTPRGY